MDDLRNREYNGWENRWTWLVHLHLSNEQALFLEIAQLVASEPDDVLAGLLVEAWVRSAITSWMNRFPGHDRRFDEHIALLTWDLLGAALAYTEWDDLLTLLSGGDKATNVLTVTLTQHIQQSPPLGAHVRAVIRRVASLVMAADALRAWFEAVLAEWIEQMAVGRHITVSMLPLFGDLLQEVYGMVVWEHVARAFRPGC